MTKPTKTLAINILRAAAGKESKKMGNDDSNLPEITPDKLQEWMPQINHKELIPFQHIFFADCTEIPKDDESGNWVEIAWYRLIKCQLQHAEEVPIQTDEVNTPMKLFPGEPEMLLPTTVITNREEIKPRTIATTAMIAILLGWNGEANLSYFKEKDGISSLEDGVIVIHKLWKNVNDKYKGKFYHPIEPIVGAYLKEITAKHISVEHDRKYPIAIIKNPIGSIREINFVDANTVARLREFAIPESITEVKQLPLDIEQTNQTVLPDVMYLDIALPFGIKPKTKNGAVSHILRIFFEALMALKPNQTNEVISFMLGDLIDYLYPKGKFHRTNQLPYIIDALNMLHSYATVPFEIASGRLGKWRPVVVRNALDRNSRNDDKIFLDVRLPPDAKQGMLIEKQVFRHLGQKSAPKLSAYMSACAIFDKYGTQDGRIIDPTSPVINRNTEGYLVDANGNELIDRKGKKMKNAYQSEAIAQQQREPNPQRGKYPILTKSDLIKACNLHNLPQQRLALKRAKEYWTELESIVKIEKFCQGWRIMPSERHIDAYRAVIKASKAFR